MGWYGATGLPDHRPQRLATSLLIMGTFSPEKRRFSCFLPTGTNRNHLNGCIALGTGPFRAELHAEKGKPRGHFNNKQGELLKCFTASLRQSNLCVYLEKKIGLLVFLL